MNNYITTHFFDIRIAEKIGINEAIVFQNILFWVAKNQANNKNFKDGRYWTYNSYAAFKTLIPYLSESKIKRAILNLEKNDLLISENFNINNYDKTKWYSIGDSYNSLITSSDTSDQSNGHQRPIDQTPMTNRLDANDQSNGLPCPIIIGTDGNTDGNNSRNIDKEKSPVSDDVVADNFKTEKEVLEPLKEKPKNLPKGKQNIIDYQDEIEFAEHEGIKIPIVSMELSREFLNRKIALDTFLLQNKITEDDIKVALVEFCKHLNIEESFYFDFKDFKSHFVNWYRRTDKDLLKSRKRTPEVKLSKEAMIRKEFGA